MEIEAKFSFRDPADFAGWLDRPALGPFRLGPDRVLQIADTYLDGPRRECLTAGYACRVRLQDGRAIATLKSLADAQAGSDGVRRREEYEVELSTPAGATDRAASGDPAPGWQQPGSWPESAARTLALRLLGGQQLRPLATLWQERHDRAVIDTHGVIPAPADTDGTLRGRTVATLSLDRVTFSDGEPPMCELECELRPTGSEADMAAIVAVLKAEAAFTAQPRSKLQRALSGARLPALPRLLLPAGGHDTALAMALAHGLYAATPAPSPDGARLLDLAAALLGAGREARAAAPAHGARDLLLAGPLRGLEEGDHALLAGAFGLLTVLDKRAKRRGEPAGHLGRKRAAGVPAYAALGGAAAAQARELAVVLHLAEALDAAGCARIAAATVTERGATIIPADGCADAAAEVIAAGAALWAETFGTSLEVAAGGKRLGLRYDLPLEAAGRQILAAQLARLDEGLASLRDPAAAEALHDARVAARRMRSALRLLDRAYPRREARPLERGLKRLAAALGAVRDLDVLIARVRDGAGDGAPEPELAALLQRWEDDRVEAQRALLARLDGAPHAVWRAAMAAFLAGESRGRNGDRRVCAALPALLWRRYGRVRTYGFGLDAADDPTLHELRKQVRELRYALELFQEVLGEDVGRPIARAVELQDALGALHDTVVLRGLLERRGASGVLLARTLAALAEQRRAARALWPRVGGAEFRTALAEACAWI